MKYLVLNALRAALPGYLSGESLSRRLEVSRTAVWKHINELRQEGYVVDSVPNRGYKLVCEPDGLNSHELSEGLETAIIGRKVYYFDELDSTNLKAKAIAADCGDGTVVAAGKQTAGRGRLGRKWESPAGSGIYLSVVLKPEIPPGQVQLVTLAASVAAAAALKEAAGISAAIKWPNDIVAEGRKLCGILTEMSSELDRVNFVVLGIGINFSQKMGDFPEDLRDRAISVLECMAPGVTCRKAVLVRTLFRELDRLYRLLLEGRDAEIVREWKSVSATLGKDVAVLGRDGGILYTGRAEDLTEDGRLVVLCNDGTRREILSGEVSVRGLLGYTHG